MADQLTCGQGLAESSAIPAALGALMVAMAEVLEAHTEALVLEDENTRREYEAYVSLVGAQREAAGRLRAIAEEMAGYRDLPMARHDPQAMASARVVAAFEKFVSREQELLMLLEERLELDRSMLSEIRQSAGS